jgi:hypothetical protein
MVMKSDHESLAMKRKPASDILGRLSTVRSAHDAELADREPKAKIAEEKRLSILPMSRT